MGGSLERFRIMPSVWPKRLSSFSLQNPVHPQMTTLILDSSQLALQVHESVGHPIELDRILGTEASYAGTSFLNPEMVGHFRYGSEQVNIVADATVPEGSGNVWL